MGEIKIGKVGQGGNPGQSVSISLPDGRKITGTAGNVVNSGKAIALKDDQGNVFIFGDSSPQVTSAIVEIEKSDPPKKKEIPALPFYFKVLQDDKIEGFNEEINLDLIGYSKIGILNTGEGYRAILQKENEYIFLDENGNNKKYEVDPSNFKGQTVEFTCLGYTLRAFQPETDERIIVTTKKISGDSVSDSVLGTVNYSENYLGIRPSPDLSPYSLITQEIPDFARTADIELGTMPLGGLTFFVPTDLESYDFGISTTKYTSRQPLVLLFADSFTGNSVRTINANLDYEQTDSINGGEEIYNSRLIQSNDLRYCIFFTGVSIDPAFRIENFQKEYNGSYAINKVIDRSQYILRDGELISNTIEEQVTGLVQSSFNLIFTSNAIAIQHRARYAGTGFGLDGTRNYLTRLIGFTDFNFPIFNYRGLENLGTTWGSLPQAFVTFDYDDAELTITNSSGSGSGEINFVIDSMVELCENNSYPISKNNKTTYSFSESGTTERRRHSYLDWGRNGMVAPLSLVDVPDPGGVPTQTSSSDFTGDNSFSMTTTNIVFEQTPATIKDGINCAISYLAVSDFTSTSTFSGSSTTLAITGERINLAGYREKSIVSIRSNNYESTNNQYSFLLIAANNQSFSEDSLVITVDILDAHVGLDSSWLFNKIFSSATSISVDGAPPTPSSSTSVSTNLVGDIGGESVDVFVTSEDTIIYYKGILSNIQTTNTDLIFNAHSYTGVKIESVTIINLEVIEVIGFSPIILEDTPSIYIVSSFDYTSLVYYVCEKYRENTTLYLVEEEKEDEEDEVSSTVEISVAQIPSGTEDQDVCYAEIYQFNTETLKWERKSNGSSAISEISSESAFVSYKEY